MSTVLAHCASSGAGGTQPLSRLYARVNLAPTSATQADSAEAPRIAPLAEQPRSPDLCVPIAFSFAPRHLLPCALAGTLMDRTSAITPAGMATRTGNRRVRSIGRTSLPASADGAALLKLQADLRPLGYVLVLSNVNPGLPGLVHFTKAAAVTARLPFL